MFFNAKIKYCISSSIGEKPETDKLSVPAPRRPSVRADPQVLSWPYGPEVVCLLRPRVLARAYDHTRRYCTGQEARLVNGDLLLSTQALFITNSS